MMASEVVFTLSEDWPVVVCSPSSHSSALLIDRSRSGLQVIDIGVAVAFDSPADQPVNLNMPPNKSAVACRSVEDRVHELSRLDLSDLFGAEFGSGAQAVGDRPRGDLRARLANINSRRQGSLDKAAGRSEPCRC